MESADERVTDKEPFLQADFPSRINTHHGHHGHNPQAPYLHEEKNHQLPEECEIITKVKHAHARDTHCTHRHEKSIHKRNIPGTRLGKRQHKEECAQKHEQRKPAAYENSPMHFT